MKMKTGGISGGADEEGRADAGQRCAVCRPNVLKPRSVPARRAAQRRAKQPARPAARAAAADGVRLPAPFQEITARRAVSSARPQMSALGLLRPGARAFPERAARRPVRPEAPRAQARGAWSDRALQKAVLPEGEEARGADNHVVTERNSQKLACPL